MILADTSVWIRHIRFGESGFSRLLTAGNIVMHPFVMGELALGSLKDRSVFLEQLRQMIQVAAASDDEVMQLIESRKIYNSGIGYADAHLLASVSLSPGTLFWTFDKRLAAAAERLSVSYLSSDD